MSSKSFSIRLEHADDFSSISTLTDQVFGPAMLTRAAYALREGVPHEETFSFVAVHEGALIGSVRLTKFMWGSNPALMLGPIGVLAEKNNQGVGKALMLAAVGAAKEQAEQGAIPIIMLVGDYDYYAPFGFERIPHGQISLPRPADPARILACQLVDGCLSNFDGIATRYTRGHAVN